MANTDDGRPGAVLDRMEGQERDLRRLRPLVVFVDGLVAGPMLCAWALTRDGARELLALAPGSKDSADDALAFLRALRRRGLGDPVLVVTDGESALLRAGEICFPTALHQRCLAHHARHLGHRLPPDAFRVLQAVRACHEAPSPTLARTLRQDVVRRHAERFPSMVAFFDRTFESCIAHLHLPPVLQRVSRATLAAEWMHAAQRRAGGVTDVASMARALEDVLRDGRLLALTPSDHARLDALANALAREARAV